MTRKQYGSSEGQFFLGRVVASSYEQAFKELTDKLAGKGYRITGNTNLKPSPIQPWPGEMWWDYMAEVEEVEPCNRLSNYR